MPVLEHELAGVRITGEQYLIRLHPVDQLTGLPGEPTLSIAVLAMPKLTGFPRPAQMNGEDAMKFSPADIRLGERELRCLRAKERTAFFRSGFMLHLEAGVSALLATAITHVDTVSLHNAIVRDALKQLLGRTLVAAERVAHCVLDRQTLAEAMVNVGLDDRDAKLPGEGDDPQHAELGAALRRPEIVALLAQFAAAGETKS